MTNYHTFKQLHQLPAPLLLGNVWNAGGARIFETKGFAAVGTSSAAVANSLGYEDGENLAFSELLFVVERIAKCISIPLSVDMEAGFSATAAGVAANISRLAEAGVAGINLEDSIILGQRKLLPTEQFAAKLSDIKEELRKAGVSMFINLRTDGFLLSLPNALQETLERIQAYEQAGADGIFVPCIEAASDIAAVVAATRLPVNVMCMPQLPSFDKLTALGVKRISMGNSLHKALDRTMEHMVDNILRQQSFNSLF